MLESYIRNRLKEKEILLMTHIVLGYPSFEDSFRIIEAMVNAGVDLMELQIPFSEPMADGAVILHANQKSLSKGSTVKKCLEFSGEVIKNFDIPFLFMSYYIESRRFLAWNVCGSRRVIQKTLPASAYRLIRTLIFW